MNRTFWKLLPDGVPTMTQPMAKGSGQAGDEPDHNPAATKCVSGAALSVVLDLRSRMFHGEPPPACAQSTLPSSPRSVTASAGQRVVAVQPAAPIRLLVGQRGRTGAAHSNAEQHRAADAKLPQPSIGSSRCLMARWLCSVRVFKGSVRSQGGQHEPSEASPRGAHSAACLSAITLTASAGRRAVAARPAGPAHLVVDGRGRPVGAHSNADSTAQQTRSSRSRAAGESAA